MGVALVVPVGAWMLKGKFGHSKVSRLPNEYTSTGATLGSSTGTGTARVDQVYIDDFEDDGSELE